MNRREETSSVYVSIFIVSFVHAECRFSLYFILTARNAILSGGYLLPHCIYRFGGINDAGGYHCQKIVSLLTTQSNMGRV